MKFELVDTEAVRTTAIRMMWSWDEWRLTLWHSHPLALPTYGLRLRCVCKDSDTRTVGARIPPSVPIEAEPRVRMVTLVPLLMLAMWVIKEFEPVDTGAINRRWVQIMLHLGWEPHGEFVYPTIDQIAELYKEGGPEWKHLL